MTPQCKKFYTRDVFQGTLWSGLAAGILAASLEEVHRIFSAGVSRLPAWAIPVRMTHPGKTSCHWRTMEANHQSDPEH
ncbi:MULTISPECIES: hypothetical protein [Caballeronia]|uniref:hypothetical protein n=1 Tax=Caballeronia TaxID=1827195 RepID=UPI000AB99729|nr:MULTISPECIES: hypothetical protein [Caballeronia]